jgi:hypothetical protein
MKHINKLCGKNEFLNIEASGYSTAKKNIKIYY